jgi:hypothetical protein
MVGIKKRKKEIMGDWKNNFIAKNPSPFKRVGGDPQVLDVISLVETNPYTSRKSAKNDRLKPTPPKVQSESTKVVLKKSPGKRQINKK